MNPITTIILGFIMVIGSPIAWKKMGVDPFIALIVFFIGISLITTGHM
jgi:uncharacterized membrane protein